MTEGTAQACVLASIAAHAARAPFRPAIVSRENAHWRVLCYGELAQSIDGWARIFRAHAGAAAGGVVPIVLRHGLEGCAAFLGAMRAGLLPAFLPFPTPKQDRALYRQSQRAVLHWLSPIAVVTYPELAAALQDVLAPGTSILIATAPPAAGDAELPALAEVARPNAPALLQHSSGTTGLKKGVRLTHGQIRAQLAAYAAALGMTAEDRVITWLPLYHDMGLIAGFLLPLALGAPLVCMDAFDWLARPALFLEAASYFRSTLCWLPNFALAHLVRTVPAAASLDLSAMRAVINCSEPCKPATMARFAAHFAPCGLRAEAVQTCYAMAETVFAVTQSALAEPPKTLALDTPGREGEARIVPPTTPGARLVASCGTPLRGVQLRIAGARPDWHAAAVAQIGEIQIRAEFAFDGYHAAPEANESAFADGWYRSGDLGFLHEGELYVTGRTKDILIVHGRNYYAHDLEDIAGEVPGVKPGRAVAVAEGGAESEAAVIIAETELTEAESRRTLQRAIHDAVQGRLGLTLRRVELVAPGQLIKTTSGKLSREENRKRFVQEAA